MKKKIINVLLVTFVMTINIVTINTCMAESTDGVEEYYLEGDIRANKSKDEENKVEATADKKAPSDIKKDEPIDENKVPKITREGDEKPSTDTKEEFVITKTKKEYQKSKEDEKLDKLYLGVKRKDWLQEIYIIKNIKPSEYDHFFESLIQSEQDWYMKQLIFQSEDEKIHNSSIYMYHKKNLDKLRSKPITLASTTTILIDESHLFSLIDIMYYTYFYHPDATIKDLTDVIVYSSGMISRGVPPIKVKNITINKLEKSMPIPNLLEYMLKETPSKL